MTNFGGIILAGGSSTRMGRPKALLPFGEELLLQRVVRILGQVVNPIVVVGATQQELPPLPSDVLMARDEVANRGPLQGLAAGMDALKDHTISAYACSCDVPLLKPSFVQRMCQLLEGHQIAVPYVGGFHHPLAAIYRIELRTQVNALLAQDRRRPVFLFESTDTRVVTEEQLSDIDPQLESLRNCNCPHEYEQALAAAGLG